MYNKRGSKMGTATGRQQMQHLLVLADHTDHLLRFSFIASICFEEPRVSKEQKRG